MFETYSELFDRWKLFFQIRFSKPFDWKWVKIRVLPYCDLIKAFTTLFKPRNEKFRWLRLEYIEMRMSKPLSGVRQRGFWEQTCSFFFWDLWYWYMLSNHNFLKTLRNFYEDRKFYHFHYFYSFLVFPFSLKLPIVTCFIHTLYSTSDLQENVVKTCNYR